MRKADFAIIGGGFAGAATAYFLTKNGAKNVLLLEQEEVVGLHSSGRNASMIRQVDWEKSIAEASREGARFLREMAPSWPADPKIEPKGSLLLANSEAVLAKLRQAAKEAREEGVIVEELNYAQAVEMVPVLEGAQFRAAIYTPNDGTLDVNAFLEGYIAEARSMGAVFNPECPVTGIRKENGRVAGVETKEGFIETGVVINASGPWAGAVGAMAEASPIGFKPMRRTLYVTPPIDWVEMKWPNVWDVENGWYFRPESGGLLLSACDEALSPPEIPEVEDDVTELLAEKLEEFCPQIAEVSIYHSWAGLRTFAPDKLFVIGWDPQIEGFFWVAGLGGHGVTCSSYAGRIAAEQLLSGRTPEEHPFSPARFE